MQGDAIMKRIELWPGKMPYDAGDGFRPYLTYYEPRVKRDSYTAAVICPGGGYSHRATHEGAGYAEFLAGLGIAAFVVEYRVSPSRFPAPLIDSRRAVRIVRSMADELSISRVLIMGSSAGGHLAAITSTYLSPIEGERVDEIDTLDFLPDGQILCYPVTDIHTHRGSYECLLGDAADAMSEAVNPTALITPDTPQAFIWHTANDGTVDVRGTYRFASRLVEMGVPHELHVFPDGLHGLGLADEGYRMNSHVAGWAGMLTAWLKYNRFI